MDGLRSKGTTNVRGDLGSLKLNQRESTLVSGWRDEEDHLDDGTPLSPTTRRSRRVGRNRRQLTATWGAATQAVEPAANAALDVAYRSQDDTTDWHDSAVDDTNRVARGSWGSWRGVTRLDQRPAHHEDQPAPGPRRQGEAGPASREDQPTTGPRRQGEAGPASREDQPTTGPRRQGEAGPASREDQPTTGPRRQGEAGPASREDQPTTGPRRQGEAGPASREDQPTTGPRRQGEAGPASREDQPTTGPRRQNDTPQRTSRTERNPAASRGTTPPERRGPAVFGLRVRDDEPTAADDRPTLSTSTHTPDPTPKRPGAEKQTPPPPRTPATSKATEPTAEARKPRARAFGARPVADEPRTKRSPAAAPSPARRGKTTPASSRAPRGRPIRPALLAQRKRDLHARGPRSSSLTAQLTRTIRTPAAPIPTRGMGLRPGVANNAINAAVAATRLTRRAVTAAVTALASLKALVIALIVVVVLAIIMALLSVVPAFGFQTEEEAKKAAQSCTTQMQQPGPVAPQPCKPVEGAVVGELGSGTWVSPLADSYVTSLFGYRGCVEGVGCADYIANHNGLDLATSGGTGTVVAATDLVITEVSTNWDAGLPVIGHAPDDPSIGFKYLHCAEGSHRVRAGQTVAAGTPLCIEGQSGYVNGRHLHFMILKDGTPVDPEPYLIAKGVPLRYNPGVR